MGDIKKKWTSIKEKEILFVFVREKFLSDRVTKKAAISRANPVFMHRCEGLVAQWPWPVDQYQERYLLKRSRVAAFHLMCSHKQVLVRRSVSARLRRSSAPHLSGPRGIQANALFICFVKESCCFFRWSRCAVVVGGFEQSSLLWP